MSEESTYYSGKEDVKLNIDFEKSRVDILGSDVVITSSSGERTVLPGLGITLFGDNPPAITANGKRLLPDDFLSKIGKVQNLKPHEIDDVVTTFDKNDGKKQTEQEGKKAEKEVVVKEVVKVEQVFIDMNPEKQTKSGTSASADNQTVRNNIAEAAEKKRQDQTKRADYDTPIDNLVPPEVVFSSPPTPSLLAFGDGYTSLSSNIKLLQTPYSLDFDSDTSMLTIYGGNGPVSAAFNDGRANQVEAELIDLSEYIGEATIYTHNTEYFSDNLITRVISFEALMPERYFLSELTISGIPSGFSLAGYTPNSDGDYVFELGQLLSGNVQFLLQYDPNQFSDPPTDLDGDGVANEYANFDVTFTYGAGLLTEEVATSVNTALEDEVVIPVVVKQASADDYLYQNNPDGWVIDIDLNDNVVLTGNSDSVVHGSNAVDNITAGLGNDEAYGSGGDDIIRTGVGNDIISGGIGSNIIDGGANTDMLTYEERTEDITVNLSEGADEDGFHTATVGSDYIDLIRAIENLILGSGNDDIRGSLDDNIIEGRDGDDTLDGALGNDTLSGGDGDDILKSGFGDNILDGNDGEDTVQYLQSDDNITTDLRSVDEDGYFDVDHGENTDKVKNISSLEGSNYDDSIIGDENNHSYYGHDGDDIIDGGAGLDVIDGGEGTDIATFASLATAISVNGNDVTDADGNVETLVNIERIFGTHLDDTFTGTSSDEDYSGLTGDDIFIGSLGNDIIDGGTGTDNLDYRNVASNLTFDLVNFVVTSIGGSSLRTDFTNIEELIGSSSADDVINYTEETQDVTINLSAGTTSVNNIQDFTVSGIENAETGSGHDSFTGDDEDNHFQGHDGDDIFYASAGADTIDGGAGSDILNIDTSATGSINLDTEIISGFASEDIENDTITSIENVTQTGIGDVTITGNGEANTIITGAGSDTVYMGAGDDIVELGAGNDVVHYAEGNNQIDGGTGTDHFDISGFSSAVTLNLNELDDDGYATLTTADGITTIKNIEDVTGTADADNITGNDEVNHIIGGDGDDVLDGGRGLDVIDGGDGTDTATYVSLTAAISVNGDSVTDADYYIENVTDIEIIAGTNYDDDFTGNTSNNYYIGNDGDDNFSASLGSDTIEGGDGTDTLDFGVSATNTALTINLAPTDNKVATGTSIYTLFNGVENIIGSSQTDTVTYAGTASDVTVNLATGFATGLGGDADYTLAGIENATGGDGDDHIAANNNIVNFLDGGDGSDTLVSSTSQSGTLNLSLVGVNQITSGYTAGDEELTGDTVRNFENFEHTGTGAQTVIGSSDDNIIRTGSGDDIIRGGAGADTLDGNYANAQIQEDYVFEDFEDGISDAWTSQYGTNIIQKTVETSEANFTNFLGRSGEISNANEWVTRTYTVTGTKEHAVLEFDLYEIDSWDYEQINFYINDTEIFREHLQGSIEAEYVQRGQVAVNGMTVHYIFSPQTDLENLGFNSQNDQKHKVYLVIENPEAEIRFATLSGTNHGYTDEAYGIDNVKFYSTNNLLGTDDGVDTLSYASDTIGVTINLNDMTASGTGSEADGDVIANFDNVIGGSGDDIITTRDYAVNDIDAGAGNDRVVASIGTGDVLDGGAGDSDTLVVRHTRGTITDLSTNTVTYAEYGDDLFEDDFENFENYESTAFTFEKVIGTSGDNIITTGQYSDYLEGGEGDDTLDGGDGDNDWASYENDINKVTADLEAGTAASADSDTDTLINIENIRTGAAGDEIAGSTIANTIDGGAGNDTISADAGSDKISGKAGDDTLNGDEGADFISGGQGTDTLNGGAGVDYIAGDATYLNGMTHFYSLSEGEGIELYNQITVNDNDDDTITQGYSFDQLAFVDLDSGDGLNWEQGAPDGSAYLSFSHFNDNPRPNLPSITLGQEFSVSSWVMFDQPREAQNDFIFRLYADGNNFIDAYRSWNTGNMYVRFEHNNVYDLFYAGWAPSEEWFHFSYTMDDIGRIRVYIDGVQTLGTQSSELVTDPVTYTSNFIGFGVTGAEDNQIDGGMSQFAIHDRALSTVEAAALYTDTKNGLDIFTIDAGDDIINGEDGNDTLSGGEGSDTVSGGEGDDIIEQVSNQVDNAGDPTDHTNILNGDDGDDTIYARVANNTIDGGSGTDVLSYNYLGDGRTHDLLTIDLSSGASYQGTVTNGANPDGFKTDNFQNIEDIRGGTGADTFIGDAGDNIFRGNDGGDNFYGAAGDDTLYGGEDIDTVKYSAADSFITIDLETSISGSNINGTATNDGDGGTDTLQNIENVDGSDFGDTVTGSSLANILRTGDGDDIIYASEGTDTINGGDGDDILDYTNYVQDEIVDIDSETVTGAETDSDSYSNIEQINLGSGDDRLFGSADDVFANTINFDFGVLTDTVEVTDGTIANNIVDIADDFSNLEILDFSGADGATIITGDDVADLTDANNSLRLDISSSFNLTVSSGADYALTTTIDNGTHTTYNFEFSGLSAELDVYTV